MKKITITLLLISALTSVSFSQIKTAVTTEEEYNYMTKGYRMQLEGGLDMKKGYIIGTESTINVGTYNFKFIPLFKVVGAENILIGYICKAVSTTWNNVYWYGFPIGDKDLLNRTFAGINTLDEPMTTAFFLAYAQFNLGK